MKKKTNLPDIPESDRTPVINRLLKVINQQSQAIQTLASNVKSLKDEIRHLKKHKQKPKIRLSKIDEEDKDNKERWHLPEGGYVIGRQLQDDLKSQHFGPNLSYILHQYHHQDVTRPLWLEQLSEGGLSNG